MSDFIKKISEKLLHLEGIIPEIAHLEKVKRFIILPRILIRKIHAILYYPIEDYSDTVQTEVYGRGIAADSVAQWVVLGHLVHTGD